jgi:hypothetical protein
MTAGFSTPISMQELLERGHPHRHNFFFFLMSFYPQATELDRGVVVAWLVRIDHGFAISDQYCVRCNSWAIAVVRFLTHLSTAQQSDRRIHHHSSIFHACHLQNLDIQSRFLF